MHVSIGNNYAKIVGFACLEQMRSVDLQACPFKKLGQLSTEILNEILDYFPAFFDL